MTAGLQQAAADYLKVRRSLGYKMARPEKLLVQFTSYLEQAGAVTVTAEHALAWSVLPGGDPSWHAYRLAVVRGFATWLATIDPDTQVPAAQLIPSRKMRATPYLYADAEITAAAQALRFPLRTATYQVLIGLLAVTGMRVGEAIALNRADADLPAGVLTIREGKHGKSRLVPLHPTTTRALRDYLQVRDQLCSRLRTDAVFISPAGTRLLYCNVHATWKQLSRPPGCGLSRRHADRGYMISVTRSRSARCWTPMTAAGTVRPRWRYWPPTSVTLIPLRPTGT
jgi:integrase